MIKSPFPGEFDALARQYWNTWNEMLGQSGGFQGWAPPGGLPGGMNNPFAAAGIGNNPFANNPFAASLAGNVRAHILLMFCNKNKKYF